MVNFEAIIKLYSQLDFVFFLLYLFAFYQPYNSNVPIAYTVHPIRLLQTHKYLIFFSHLRIADNFKVLITSREILYINLLNKKLRCMYLE